MTKNLKYFMRDDAKDEPVITIPGIEGFNDENGKVIPLEVKRLSKKNIQAIMDGYKTKEVALDPKGNPYIFNGLIAHEEKYNESKAIRHVIAEALRYPNLKDPEMMKFFGCYDITEMPPTVFSKGTEYEQLLTKVYSVLNGTEEAFDAEIEAAKN